jgi:hypothetical protein
MLALPRLAAPLLFVFLRFASAQSVVVVTIPAAEPTDAPQYVSGKLFELAVLNSTNFWRQEYNATALAWNASLASYAQNYSAGCEFQHSVGRNAEAGGEEDAFGLTRLLAWPLRRESRRGLLQRDGRHRRMGRRGRRVRFRRSGVQRADGPLHATGLEVNDERGVRQDILQWAK